MSSDLRVPAATLSPVARALLHRPIAQLVIEARCGGPRILRDVGSRYIDAATELEEAGHSDVATILDVYGAKALRLAREIEAGLTAVRPAPWLKLVAP